MGTWVMQQEDTNLPYWLQENLKPNCPYCGKPMMNYYNENGRCTNRKCSNKECCGMIAAKADFVRKLLKLDGLGFKTCLRDIQISKARDPFELLAFWHIKPTVPLHMFLRMHCFEGIDNEWEDIVQTLGIYTLDELYDKYNGKWWGLLDLAKDRLYENLKYVELTGRPEDMVKSGPKLVLTIMITGTPIGWASKDEFVNTLNSICRGIIVIKHQKTKRQTNVDCLIREPGSTTRGKVEAAIKGGIPILTSEQFIKFLTAQMLKYNPNAQNSNSEVQEDS